MADAFASLGTFDEAFPNLSELLVRGKGQLAVQCSGARSYDELRAWATFHALAPSPFLPAPIVIRVVHDKSNDRWRYSLATLLCDLEACLTWIKGASSPVELWLCQPGSSFFEDHSISLADHHSIPLLRGDNSSPMAAMLPAASWLPHDFTLVHVPCSGTYLRFDVEARLPRLSALISTQVEELQNRPGFAVGTAMADSGWFCAEKVIGERLSWTLRGHERMHSAAATFAQLELSLPTQAAAGSKASAPEPKLHLAYCKHLVQIEVERISANIAYPTLLKEDNFLSASKNQEYEAEQLEKRRRAAMARMLAHDGFRETSLFHTFYAEAKAREVRDDPLDVLDRTVLSPPTSFD